MMADPATRKLCTTAGCGTPLRSDNESGLCKACKRGAPVKEKQPARLCSTPGCGHVLGPANKSGVCSPCQGHGGAVRRVKPPPRPEGTTSRPPAPPDSVGERFRKVTKALGFEPDDVLEPVMKAWLDRVDAAAVVDQAVPKPKRRKAKADEYALPGDDEP